MALSTIVFVSACGANDRHGSGSQQEQPFPPLDERFNTHRTPGPADEQEAVKIAKDVASQLDYSLPEHTIIIDETSTTWIVSLVPTDPDQTGGGLVISIEKDTGQVESAILQQ